MQNGQSDNLGNRQSFSPNLTDGSSGPENSFGVDRNFGNVGNSVVTSLNSNQETLLSAAQPENVINFPQVSQETSEQSLGVVSEVDQNSAQLGVQLETNQPSQGLKADEFKRNKEGNISQETLNAVIREVQKFQKPGSSESPANLVDEINRARGFYRETFENPYYTGGKAA